MAKRPFVEFILQVINLVFLVWGLGTLGYGLACFFKWKQTLPNGSHRLLLQQSQETLPKAFFIYVMIGIGAILLIVSCLGYVGTAIRIPCCLLTYCVFLVPLIIVELGIGLLIFFDHSWKKVIPKDIDEDIIYNFLNDHWKIIRWIALGEFILQIIALILAIYLRSVFSSTCYDSDEERVENFLRSRKENYNRLVAPTHVATLSRSSTRVGVRANARDSTKPAGPSNTNDNARDATKRASSSITAANVDVKDATTSTNNVV